MLESKAENVRWSMIKLKFDLKLVLATELFDVLDKHGRGDASLLGLTGIHEHLALELRGVLCC